MEPELNEGDLQSILMYCAYLRNVYYLPHRTLHEFDWFVGALIFGGMGVSGDLEEDMDEIKKRWGYIYRSGPHPNMLLSMAKAFLEYCREKYVEKREWER